MSKRIFSTLALILAGLLLTAPVLATGDLSDVLPEPTLFEANPEVISTTELDTTSADTTEESMSGGSVYAAASDYVIEDDVENDVIIMGEQIVINGNVGDNVYLMGGNVLINGNVAGDVLVAAGNIVINGSIGGDLRVVAGQVYINSEIIFGEIFIPGAGTVAISENTAHEAKQTITSSIFIREATDNPTDLTGFPEDMYFGGTGFQFEAFGPTLDNIFAGLAIFAAVMSILMAIGMFIAGYAILRGFPVLAEKSFTTMQKRWWESILVGAFAWFLSPFITLFLLLTIVGIPILGVLVTLAGVVWLFGNVYATYMVGRLILKQLNMNKTGRALALLVGSILVGVVGFILNLLPIVGFLFSYLLLSWGSGAMLINKWDSMRSNNGKE